MKTKRTRSSLNSEQRQQSSLTQTKSDLYLPDECWECVVRFLNNDNKHNNNSLTSFSAVSKQFLSIINRLRFSITIRDPTCLCLSRLFQRFPNLTSLRLAHYFCDDIFCWISSLASSISLKYTQINSVYKSNSFVVGPQLKSLHLIFNPCLRDESILRCCRGLLQLVLDGCAVVTEMGVKHALEKCTQLREINLKYGPKVRGDVLASLIFSRPSLRKITITVDYRFRDREMEHLSRQGCIVC